MTDPFFTIGHSTHPLSEFVGLLRGSRIELLVDVRSIPRSRTNPQFNRDTLPDALAPEHIGYVHLAPLGGRRSSHKGDGPSPNGYWTVPAFRSYADYATSTAFRDGLAQLLELGHRRRCAIMCAEAVWWRCHRRIITDYLLLHGETVLHIMDARHANPATMTPGAQPQPDGTLIYPAETGH
jgi:uncharacterized protein (DUF488 family)